MAIVTLFGPPEPATSKVTGTARAINYLPKINQAGVLCWVQRPGLTDSPWQLVEEPPIEPPVEHDCTSQGVWGAPPLGLDWDEKLWGHAANNVLFADTMYMTPEGDLPHPETTIALYNIGSTQINKTIFIDYQNEDNSQITLVMYGVENEEDATITIPHSATRTTYTFTSTGFSAIWLNNTLYNIEELPAPSSPIANTKSWVYCIAIEEGA